MQKLNKDWIIGFSEGEGSWFIRQASGRRGFEIGQKKKDSQILYRLKSTLGFGKVYHNRHIEISRFVMLKDQQERIFDYFNQHLRLKKSLKRFQQWSANLPSRSDILQTQVKVTPLQDNAWLSGFIDAEGCFRVAEDKGRGKVIFEISQKEREILERIGEYLKLKQNIRLDRECYVLATSAKEARARLIRYLEQYPLKTQKRIALALWKKAHELAIQGELKGEKLQKIRQRINKTS